MKRRARNLSEMISKGTLKVGQKLFAQYKGQPITATVNRRGDVKIDGETVHSLSTAARRACAKRGKENPAVNGWGFFKVKQGRNLVVISDLRG